MVNVASGGIYSRRKINVNLKEIRFLEWEDTVWWCYNGRRQQDE